jgi:hypothetical protein
MVRAMNLQTMIRCALVSAVACTPGGEDSTGSAGQTTGGGPGGESSGPDATGSTTGTTEGPTTDPTTDPTGGETGEVPTGPYAACGAGLVDPQSGEVNAELYKKLAEDWSKEAIDCRLGPTWEELHDGDSANNAAEVWGPAGMTCDGGYLTVGIPVQAGVCPAGGGCYGSVSGQVVFAPEGGIVGPATPGVDRVQTHAWEQGAISSHPKLLDSPEPFVTQPGYQEQPLGQPIAVVRSERHWTNDGLMIFADGTVATGGTATSGSSGALYRFPAHLKPSAIAVTSNNEFVLVTLWNTQEVRGELAVLSVRAPTPNAHSWWYHGLFNVAGVRELKFLGTIALPFATPTSVAAVTTGSWTNPNDAGGKLMSQLSFTGPDKVTEADRCYTSQDQMKNPNVSQTISAFADGGGLQHLVARKGYAIVGSQWEDKVAIVDLRPLLEYFRSMYFGSEESCTETLSQFVWDGQHWGEPLIPQAPPDVWPYTFEVAPESARPTIAAVFDVPAPRAVRAGQNKSMKIFNSSGVDVWKAYAAGDDGTLHVFTPGELMANWFEIGNGTEATGAPAAVSTLPICEHPTAMVMHRGLGRDRALYPDIAPEKIGDESQEVSGLSDGVVVVCRGERKLQHVVHWKGAGKVYEEIVDKRMNDPVAVWYSDRADVRTVADFNSKKILSYRFSPVKIEDWEPNGCGPEGAVYGMGPDGMADFEFSGELAVPGFPFSVTAANVN